MKDLLPFIVACVIFGCGVGVFLPKHKSAASAPPAQAEITPAPSNSPPVVHAEPAEDSLERWMRHMEIWKCEDGTYEVRTDFVQEGKFENIEDARLCKTNWARRVREYDAMIEAQRKAAREAAGYMQRLPDCGKRVE